MSVIQTRPITERDPGPEAGALWLARIRQIGEAEKVEVGADGTLKTDSTAIPKGEAA